MKGRVVLIGVAMLAAACSAGGPGASPPASTGPRGTVADTGPARVLAPSQITAVTAAPPETPPPCAVDEVTLWTARAVVFGEVADAVIRVRNDGGERCEVDVADSPSIDPAMEIDVWLDPGAWADLIVGSADGECRRPSVVRRARVDVNGTEVEVPTAAVVTCDWRLTAFFRNEIADEPCTDLVAVALDRAIVLRNVGARSCRLGALETVVGAGVTTVPAVTAVEVPDLAAGDVVAFDLVREGSSSATRAITLGFDSGATVAVDLDADAVEVGIGPPRPWIDGRSGPDTDDPVEMIAALEPFSGGT